MKDFAENQNHLKSSRKNSEGTLIVDSDRRAQVFAGEIVQNRAIAQCDGELAEHVIIELSPNFGDGRAG